MLTLTGLRKIGEFTVYNDDVNRDQYYYLPGPPRVARDDAGKPAFSLLWYCRDLDRLTEEERRTRLGGGILALTVELTVTDEQIAVIRAALVKERQLVRADGAEQFALGPVPIKEGIVTIAVLAETGAAPGEFLASLVGAGRVGVAGGQRASFMAKLTMDGAVLLWKAMEKDNPGVMVTYSLTFDHRLAGVELRVWCHARNAYSAMQTQWAHINDNARFSERHSGGNTTVSAGRDQSTDAGDRLTMTALDSEVAGVTVTPSSSEVKPDVIERLHQIGLEKLKEFLAQSFLSQIKPEPPKELAEPKLETELPDYGGRKYGHHKIDYYRLKSVDESATADLDFVATTQYVLATTEPLHGGLKEMLAGVDLLACRAQIDLEDPFTRYLNVQILCTADFAEDPVELVKVHLSYKGRGSLGEINEAKDFVFKKDSVPQFFLSYLYAPEALAYDYTVEVFYRGSQSRYTVEGRSEETILVLDTDRLGVLRVDVQAGIVKWDRIQQIVVRMSYGAGSGQRETEFILDEKKQSVRWIEGIGRAIDAPYSYVATFVDKNGQKLEMPRTTSRSPTLLVNQPLEDDLEVMVVPAGGFGSGALLSQVVVTLRYRDAANDYLVDDSVVLTKDGESKKWMVPLRNKKLRQYEYQTTVFYNDGVVREDAWATSDKNTLPVGDPFGMRVQITSNLLKNPEGQWAFAIVALSFDDPQASIHAEKTIQIDSDDFSKPVFWRFRLGAPDRHTYRYQLTLYKIDGTEVKVPWAEASQEILVLRPPQPA